MEILTKQQAAEIAYRPLNGSMPAEIIDRCINKIVAVSDEHFIRIFRKSTKLKLCAFGPEKFYIRYEN